MRRLLPLSTLLAVVACQPRGVAVPVERLDVPAQVEIVDVIAGASTLQAFQIGNSGAGDARVDLRVGDPFFVTLPSVYVPAGGTVTVRVGIRDPGYTTVLSTIEVIGPYDTATIPVSAAFDLDLDDDGFLAPAAGGSDCDDEDGGAYPSADEVCNDRDDDCDGQVDNAALDQQAWFGDRDGDGFGSPDEVVVACDRPMGFVMAGGDCDDGDQAVHPGATEVFYDGVDQDCAGTSDFDRDGDGYDHVVFGGSDCRDQDADIHPDAAEADDLVDQDCDGLVDEDFLVHGDLVITEILVSPTARAPEDGQYAELVNPSTDRTIQLRAMVVESDAGMVHLASATLAPGQVGLLCANSRDGGNDNRDSQSDATGVEWD